VIVTHAKKKVYSSDAKDANVYFVFNAKKYMMKKLNNIPYAHGSRTQDGMNPIT
jgi:hypothetical protein